ncbi:hypothetical protein AMTRI_Chr13g90860 [Amborella trichopoda]
MALMGNDGRGYELAKKLDSCGVWRQWLGKTTYVNFLPFLGSPSSWDSFMTTNEYRSRAQLQLQLRVRALLYDKASVSLFLRLDSSALPSKLNPAYLQLHADDVYFSLEDDSLECDQFQDGSLAHSSQHAKKTQSKLSSTTGKVVEFALDRASSAGPKSNESDIEDMSFRSQNGDLRETWYSQSVESYRERRSKWIAWRISQQRIPFSERETFKRTPEGMSLYLKLLEKHNKRRKIFDDQGMGFANPVKENGSHGFHTSSNLEMNDLMGEESDFFPELMFPSNCVPDSAVPSTNKPEENQNIEFCGILDNLPQGICRNPAMIERFGMRAEYFNMGIGRSKYRGKNRRSMCEEEASHLLQQALSRILVSIGFEGASSNSLEVLSQFLSCHICKLSQILRLLADSYRKQCTPVELLKMFIRTLGYSNPGALVEQLKDGTRVIPQPIQQPVRTIQPQHQAFLQGQQTQRHPQMQVLHTQNQAAQPHWDRLRRKQPLTPRGSNVGLERERPTVEVKVENSTDLPIDYAYGANQLIKQNQFQWKQQQLQLKLQPQQQQQQQQFKHLASLQIPHAQPQGMFNVRAPPVKDGFQDLMGGDAIMKHESEESKEHKLTSPRK